MKKVTTEWNLGNYNVSLTAEVSEEVFQICANYGARWLGQRNTEVDKILGAFTQKDGKDVRIPGWKRSEVGFDEGLARKLEKSFAELSFPKDGENAAVAVAFDVAISEYIREAKALKYTEEKEIAGRHESKGDLEEWLSGTVKYDGDTHGEDGEYAPAMLSAIRAYKLARLKEI